MVEIIPYDDDQSMFLFGMPITADAFDDDGPIMDNVFLIF